MKHLHPTLQAAILLPLLLPAAQTVSATPATTDPPIRANLKITELLPNPAAPAADDQDEYIEIHNPGTEPVALHSLQLKTGLNLTYTYFLPDMILAPGAYAALYSRETKLALANSGGKARLSDAAGTVLFETPPYGLAADGQAWSEREGTWGWTSELTPGSSNVPLPVAEPEPASNEPDQAADESGSAVLPDSAPDVEMNDPGSTDPLPLPGSADPVSGYSGQAPVRESPLPAVPQTETPTILITELLPNPAAPVTDADGEFIELFNAGDQPLNLDGMVLQTGLNSSYAYAIAGGVLEPHSYKVFTSQVTKLSLSNMSGKARLLTANGQVIHETAPYGVAEDGVSWAWDGSVWQWSGSPTPGLVNSFAAIPKKPTSKATSTAKTSANKTAAKKAAEPKAAGKAKSASKEPTGKKSAAKDKDKTAPADAQAASAESPLHYGVLALVATLALVYAAYEYRRDLANRFHQFRRYLAHRFTSRQTLKGQ